ncbi:MAG: hypothetical protein E7016_02045 [Alphaproteobacteria bacterium]|nr:hypothetical protein [Alphaproteobacteria bacterium]
MRKYFLLSAVALMLTSTANATTDYAEVTAKATIQVAGTFTCNNLDYGTIVVKQDNEDMVIEDNMSESEDFISMSGSGDVVCNVNDFGNDDIENTLDLLSSTSDDVLTLVYGASNEMNSLFTALHIPANVAAGVYEGSFTLTRTY